MSSRVLSFARLLGLSALLMGLSIGCGGSAPGGNPPPVEVPRPDAERSTVEVSRAQGVVADGQDASTLTVTVRRAGGEPMEGQEVRLEVSGEGASATPAQGLTDASGVWTAALTATTPGAKTVKVSVLAEGGAVVLGTQPTVTFSAPAATKLAFTSTPPSALAGVPVGPALEVAIQDARGNVVAGAAHEVTLALGSHPDGAVLEGTVKARAVNGVARFPEVVLKRAGTGYTLVASAEGLASATSAAFDVGPIEVASLTLQLSAQSVTAGAPVDLTVTLGDGLGNIKTNYVGTVRLSSPDATAELPVTEYTFTAEDAGQHTFRGFVFKRAGTAHLTVTEKELGVLLEATADVGVLPGPATKLAFTAQPESQSMNQPLAPVQVTLTDAFDNKVAVSAPEVTVALRGDSGAVLGGVTKVAPADGVATFSNLSVDTEGTGYQLTATVTGLQPRDSAPFDIVDDIAPSAPVLGSSATSSSITLTWTAVGDDADQGTAAAYALRYSTSAITDDDAFSAATPITTSAPKAAGSAETVTLPGLTPDTTYHFALKVVDNANNASPLARISATTLDPCDGVTCTPRPATCSADHRGVVTYASACVVSGDSGTCQETPTTTPCSAQEVCSDGACVPVTAAPQVGRLIVNEFRALGTEFIELRNTTASDVDVRGFILENKAWQSATLRAATDPSGAQGTPVVVPAGGVLHGVANPSGEVPAGVGFVYGAPGADFSLEDTGDLLVLSDVSGNVEDVVDFRAFVTDPNAPLSATQFVGHAGSSTQLAPGTLTAADNDTAASWCVSFYPASGAKQRVADTAGAANGSCQTVVINEVLTDATGVDDGHAFIELAGPGGAVVGGLQLADVEGLTNANQDAGELNEDGDKSAGETDGVFVLPAGTRIPADGILLIADALLDDTTSVPGFVAGVDVLARDADIENSGNTSLQLISADGTTLLDAVGFDVNGTDFAINASIYEVPGITMGLGMYEGRVALYPPIGSTLARGTSSSDTDDNRGDFHGDPTPTPGQPNDAVSVTVTGISPDDGLATAATSGVVLTGTDFAEGAVVRFGATDATCTVNNATTLTCRAPNNGGTAAVVDVTLTSHASLAVAPVTVTGGFTFTGTLNETDTADEADYCVLQWPPSLTATQGQRTDTLYARIYEGGLTDASAGQAPGIQAEVGHGPLSTDPTADTAWRFFPASFNVENGNDDEYAGSFIAPAVSATTQYNYTVRFSRDNGLSWTYCDLNGAGANGGLTFEPGELGVLTVNP